MKKITLFFVAFTMFFAVGCSDENPTEINNIQETSEDLHRLAGRGTIWDGEIGVENNGLYKITADEEILKADLEKILREEGKSVTLQTLDIRKLTASNDINDSAYLLIATDAARISIGVFLRLDRSVFTFDNSYVSSASCEGCPQGCNLNYLIIDGKRVPFCNEMGCMYDCTKTETGFY